MGRNYSKMCPILCPPRFSKYNWSCVLNAEKFYNLILGIKNVTQTLVVCIANEILKRFLFSQLLLSKRLEIILGDEIRKWAIICLRLMESDVTIYQKNLRLLALDWTGAFVFVFLLSFLDSVQSTKLHNKTIARKWKQKPVNIRILTQQADSTFQADVTCSNVASCNNRQPKHFLIYKTRT